MRVWGSLRDTLSKTLYDWRKIEPVTMKANFVHFWWVESEFIFKNQFHNWTSELGCIWHIFGKLDSFWLFSSTSVLAAPASGAASTTHQEWMNFAFIVTGSIFLHLYWVLDNFHRYFLIRSKFEVLKLSFSYSIWNFPMYCAMTGSYFLDWHLFCEIL